MATVVLLGTFDTKGAEYEFLRDRIAARGVETLMVDAGVFGSDVADIGSAEVAAAAGADLAALAKAGDRGDAVTALADGAAAIVQRLYAEGRLDGIVGLGGTGGTTLITHAMRRLPVGVPKVMVSTVASGDTRPYVGAVDITMMYSVVDIAGLNAISTRVLGNAAEAIAGMASAGVAQVEDGARPLIGATMFGVTTPAVEHARRRLAERGFEILVFHATGTGGRSMEELAKSRMLSGVLDLTTTELADELVGGVFSAGPDRLRVAGRAGLPQVVSLGALDMVNFGPIDTVPERFRERKLYQHNATTTLMRTSPDEAAELGRRMAERLNDATGPLTVFVPQQGISMIAVPGGPFHDPAADQALIAALLDGLDPEVEVRVMDTDINDERFAVAMADALADHIERLDADTGSEE